MARQLAYVREVAVRTAHGLIRFDGRARILDLVYFWLVIGLVGLLVGFPIGPLPWDAEWFAKAALKVLTLASFAAVFSRRLHDQGSSGWWSLILLPSLPVSLYQSYRATFAVLNPEWLTQPDPLDVWMPWLFGAGLVIGVACLILSLRPGTRGPNRYGRDPRDVASLAPA